MKRTYKYALSLVLSAAMVTPALAQGDNFPDVPENHWAYEALARLKKDGLLVGYEKGDYNGKRLMTRYEVASFVHRVYLKLLGTIDGLESQIKELEKRIGAAGQGGGDNTDVQSIRDALAALRQDVNMVKGWGGDINALKKLADAFQKELTSLGVDVEALKKDLSNLEKRVKALEDRKPAVDISGDVNFFVGAGFTRGNRIGLNQDGYFFGAQAGFINGVPGNQNNGAGLQDLTVLHEAGLTLKGTNDTGPKWHATFVIGNALNGFGSQAQTGLGQGTRGGSYNNAGATTVGIFNAVVEFDSSLLGLDFNAKVGRQGLKLAPHFFARVDNTSFFSNYRWDNGEWLFDGANAGIKFGKDTSLNLVIGQVSNNLTTGAVQQGLAVGAEQQTHSALAGGPLAAQNGVLGITRISGAILNTKLPLDGSLSAALLYHDTDAPVGGVNRVQAAGADVMFNVSNFKITGSYAVTDPYMNQTKINDGVDNAYAGAKVSGSFAGIGFEAGYRQIDAGYAAPGDWGRYGIVRNLNNVKGFHGAVSYSVNDALGISGNYERLEQLNGGNGLVEKFGVGVNYRLTSAWGLMAGFERTKFSKYAGLTRGDAQYDFTNVGLGYNLSASSMLSIMAQHSNIKGDVFARSIAVPGGSTGGFFQGTFLTTQLSVKF